MNKITKMQSIVLDNWGRELNPAPGYAVHSKDDWIWVSEEDMKGIYEELKALFGDNRQDNI